MYKIAILEDEYLTRLGLEKAVPWEEHNVEVSFTAGDGKTGLELIRKEKPDLVLTDIRMPGLNGVDLVKQLAKENFAGEIIVLTAYKEFDYAVETYKAGIFAYILKPIDNDELLSTIDKAINKLEEKRKEAQYKRDMEGNISAMKTHFFHSLLHGVLTKEEFISEEKKFDFNISPDGLLFVLEEEEESNTLTIGKMMKLIKDDLSSNNISSYDYLDGKNDILFINSKNMDGVLDILMKTLSLAEETSDAIFTSALYPYSNPIEVAMAYQKCQTLIKGKLYFGFNSVEIERNSDITYRHHIAVQDFYKLINEHYKEDLTVSSVSLMLNVSESYLMHLLKKSLGRTFNDILTDYRLSYAKRLLKSGKYRVNEVSDMVGYHDEKYFSKVFKKRVGVNPSEYQG